MAGAGLRRGPMTANAYPTALPAVPAVSSTFVTFVLSFLVLFETFTVSFTGITQLSMLPHLIVIFTITYQVVRSASQSRARHETLILIGLLIVLSLGSLFSRFSPDIGTIFVASVLYLKFFMLAIVFSRITLAKVHKIVVVIFYLNLIGALLSAVSMLVPSIGMYENYRFMGFQLNPSRFGVMNSILFMYFVFAVKSKHMAFICLILIVLSISKSAMLFLLFASLYLSWLMGASRLILYLIFASAITPLAYIWFSENIAHTQNVLQNTIAGDVFYLRYILLMSGLDLAKEFFPVGSGAGTFASPLSHGSHVYWYLGIGEIRTIQEGTGIHDSGIGTIIGEYGFLGCVTVLLGLAFIFKKIIGAAGSTFDVIICVICVIWLSFSRGIISSYYYSFCMILFALIIRHMRMQMKDNECPQ